MNDKSGKTYKNLLKGVDETIPDQNELQISCADTFYDKAYIYCVCCACVTNFSFNTIFMFEKIIYLEVLVKVKLGTAHGNKPSHPTVLCCCEMNTVCSDNGKIADFYSL